MKWFYRSCYMIIFLLGCRKIWYKCWNPPSRKVMRAQKTDKYPVTAADLSKLMKVTPTNNAGIYYALKYLYAGRDDIKLPTEMKADYEIVPGNVCKN